MPEMQPRRLGLKGPSCREFLEGHSEYLDQMLTPEEARRFDEHVASCRSCEHYDRITRRGLLLARNLPEIQPSPHFHERLQARLMGLEDRPVARPVVANSATVVVIAAVLALVALTPLLRIAEGPKTPADTGNLIHSFQPLSSEPFSALNSQMNPSIGLASEAFGFTPIVVQPPAAQTLPSSLRTIVYPVVQTVAQ
jgi:hypothetical protein